MANNYIKGTPTGATGSGGQYYQGNDGHIWWVNPQTGHAERSIYDNKPDPEPSNNANNTNNDSNNYSASSFNDFGQQAGNYSGYTSSESEEFFSGAAKGGLILSLLAGLGFFAHHLHKNPGDVGGAAKKGLKAFLITLLILVVVFIIGLTVFLIVIDKTSESPKSEVSTAEPVNTEKGIDLLSLEMETNKAYIATNIRDNSGNTFDRMLRIKNETGEYDEISGVKLYLNGKYSKATLLFDIPYDAVNIIAFDEAIVIVNGEEKERIPIKTDTEPFTKDYDVKDADLLEIQLHAIADDYLAFEILVGGELYE